MDRGPHVAVHARKKRSLRHTGTLSTHSRGRQKLLILPVATGSILGTHSRDALPPGLERSLAGVVMKFLALGFGLLCVLLVSMRVFRMVRLDTLGTQTAEVSSPTASPKMLLQPASGSELDLPAGTVVTALFLEERA